MFYYLNDRVIFELHTCPLTLAGVGRARAVARAASLRAASSAGATLSASRASLQFQFKVNFVTDREMSQCWHADTHADRHPLGFRAHEANST